MKICGYISTSGNQEIVHKHLKSMIDVMKHTAEAEDEFIHFNNGGIAIVKNAIHDTGEVAWDKQHLRCLALCGHLVGSIGDGDPASCSQLDTPHNDTIAQLLDNFINGRAELLNKLNGVFNFAYYDPTSEALTVVNDRYGFMPLYYYYDQGVFIFASEVKSILQIVEQQEIDWESCADFLYIGHMMGQKTLFRHIYALESAQMLTYSSGKLNITRYHDFTKTTTLAHEEVSVKTLIKLFREAVQSRVRREHPNTVLLSGGFDSRFVLGALHTLDVSPNVVSLEHASEKHGADGKLAVLLANALRLECDYRPTRKHYFTSKDWLQVFYILDGMTPNRGLFISEVYPELDTSLGIVWDGLALDVALGGSHQIKGSTQENIKEFISKRTVNRFLLRLILAPSKFHELDSTFMQRLQDEVAAVPRSENQFLYFLLKHRTRRRVAVNPYQLFATKVAPMTPAADTNFMQYILSIPSSLKLNHKLYIRVLREMLPLLTKIPIISGGSQFDFTADDSGKPRSKNKGFLKKTLKQIKQKIPPGIREIIMNYVYNYRESRKDFEAVDLIVYILETKNFERPFYNKVLLRRLFKYYRKGNTIYHRLFEIVFYIELWHLLFIDKDSPILFNPKNLPLSPSRS